MLKNKTKLFLLFSLVLITLVGVSAVSAVDVDNTTSTLEDAPSYTADTQANINTADDNNKNLEQNDVNTITSTDKDTAKEATAASTKTVEKTNVKQLKTVTSETGIDVSLNTTTLYPGEYVQITADIIEGYDEDDDFAVFLTDVNDTEADTYDITVSESETTATHRVADFQIPSDLGAGTYYVYVQLQPIMSEGMDELTSEVYSITVLEAEAVDTSEYINVSFDSPTTPGSDVEVTVTTAEELNGGLLNIELFYPETDITEDYVTADQSYYTNEGDTYITLENTVNTYTFTLPSDQTGTFYIRALVDAYQLDLFTELKSEFMPLVVESAESHTTFLYIESDDTTQSEGIEVYGILSDEDTEETENGIASQDITITITYENDEVETYTVTTESDGSFQETFTATYTGSAIITASYAGNTSYEAADADSVTINIDEDSVEPTLETLTIDYEPDISYYHDQDIMVNGLLVDESQQTVDASDITVTVTVTYSDESTQTDSTTSTNGEFAITIPANNVIGDAIITITTTANDQYEAATQTYSTEIITRPSVNITINEDDTQVTYPNDIVINGSVTSNVDDVITNVANSNLNISVTNSNSNSRNYTTTTDENGNYTYSIPLTEDDIGEVTIVVTLNDDEYVTNSAQKTVTVVEKITPEIQIEVDESYAVDETLYINGPIVDTETDENIANLAVNITFLYDGDDTATTIETSTNDDGEVDYQYTTDDGKKVGTVTVTITTGETDAYKSTSTSYTVEITAAEPKDTEITLMLDDTTSGDISVDGIITYTDVNGDTQYLPQGEIVNVQVTFADTTTSDVVEATVGEEGTFTTTIASDTHYGQATVTVTYPSNDNYNAAEATANIMVLTPTILTIETDDGTVSSGFNVTGMLIATTADDTIYLSDVEVTITVTTEAGVSTDYTATVTDGEFSITIPATEVGAVTVVATFDENEVYQSSSDSTTANILEDLKETLIYFELDEITTGDITIYANIVYVDAEEENALADAEVTITATFNDETTETLTTTSGSEGEISAVIPTDGKRGLTSVTISYAQTESYEATTTTKTTTLNSPTSLTLDADESTIDEGLTLTGYLTYTDSEGETQDLAGQTVTVTVTYDDGQTDEFTATTEDDGSFTLTRTALATGEVTIYGYFEESEEYAECEDTITTTIKEAPKETMIYFELEDTTTGNITVDANIVYVDAEEENALADAEVTITATFEDETTETLTTTSDSEGNIAAVIPTTGKYGQVNVTITYAGVEDEYVEYEATSSTVLNRETRITVEADEASQSEGLFIYGTITYIENDEEYDMADGTVTITVTYENEESETFTTTIEEGTYQVNHTALTTGAVTIDVEFEETDEYAESSDSTTTTITEDETQIETFITLDESDSSVENITVDGILETVDETPIADALVKIVVTKEDETVLGETTATTDSEGRFLATIAAEGYTGPVTITVTFDETTEYKASEANATTNVINSTRLTVFADESVTIDEELTISGTLSTYVDDLPISDATITITITYEDQTTQELTATTDENGEFTTTTTPTTTGTANITATYEETTTYAEAEDNATTTITPATKETLIYFELDETTTGNITVDANIVYVDAEEEFALPNAVVTITTTFEDGTTETTTATSDANGNITATIPTTGKYGQANVTITYAGLENQYNETESTSSTSLLKTTILSVVADETVALNEELTITGTLSTYEDDEPISDATITITITYEDQTTQELTATTDENGEFTTTTTPTTTGTANITATYEETTTYTGAEDNTTTTITAVEKETFITLGLDDSTTGDIEVDGYVQYDDGNEWINIPSGSVNIVATFADGSTSDVITATINDGNFVATIPTNGILGQATVNVTFDAVDEYLASNTSETINVIATTILSVEADESTLDEGLTIYGTLIYDDGEEHNIDSATLNVVVTYEDGQTDEFTVEVVDGEYIITRDAKAAGEVSIEVEFEETDKYASNSADTTTTITEKTLIEPYIYYEPTSPITSGEAIDINAEFGYYDADNEFIAIADATINVEVTFEDGDVITGYNTTDSEGNFIFNVDTTGKTGVANVKLTAVATDDYAEVSTTSDVTIEDSNELQTNIVLDNVDSLYYTDREATLTGSLTYTNESEEKAFAGQDVTVTVSYEDDDGVVETYTAITDDEGKFTVTITPGAFSTATITASYDGNETEDVTYSQSSTDYAIEIEEVEYDVTLDEIETEYDLNSTVEITGQVTSNLPELDISEVNITVNDNQTYTVPVDSEGKFTFVFNGTDAGDYVIIADVEGTHDNVEIHIDQEWSVIEAAVNSDKVYVGDTITIEGNLTSEGGLALAGQTVTININGTDYETTTDDDGKFTYSLDATTGGNITINASYAGSNNYYASEIDDVLTVEVKERTETVLSMDPVEDATALSPVTITGTLTDKEGNPIANQTVKVTINGEEYPVTTDENGVYSYDYVPTTSDDITGTVSFEGNDDYAPSEDVTFTITVNKRNLTIVIINTNKDVKVGDEVEITVLLVDGDRLVTVDTLTFINGTTSKDVQINDSITNYQVSSDENGTVTVKVILENDDVYNDASNQTTITFNNLNTQIVANDNSVATAKVNESVTISVDVIDENGNAVTEGTVTFTCDDETLGTATVSDGKANITTTFATAGTKDITATYSSTKNYNPVTNDYTAKAIVEKLDVNVTVTTPSSMKVGESKDITVTAKGYPNGNITVTINNETIPATTDATGKAVITYNATEAGKAIITVTVPESDNNNAQTATKTLTINKGNVTLTVTPTTTSVKYPNNATYTITLTDANSNPIVGEYIKVDGVAVNMTDSNGQVKAIVSKDVGNYTIKVEFAGSSDYAAKSTNVVLNVTKASVTVKVGAITGKVDQDIAVVANLSANITGGIVTFTDVNGTVLATADVINGQAKAYVTFDKVYNNKINATFTNNNYNTAKASANAKISALDTVVTINPINNATLGTATKITGQVTDENGNPVANTKITVQTPSGTKTTTTDSNGNFSVPYTPTTAGDNTINVSVPATNSTAAKTVTQTVNVNKLSTKLTVTANSTIVVGNNVTVNGTLADTSGNTISSAKVVVNIEGKNYAVTTDSNGKFNTTALLSEVGKAVVTVSYAGNSNYNASANVVKTVTVTKHTTKTTVSKTTGKVNTNVVVKATVKATDGTVVNDGYVIFTDNKNRQLGAAAVSNGSANVTVNYTAAFTGNVTATYTGAANFSNSTAKGNITISKLNTKVTLSAIKGKVGDVVNITVKVVDENGKAVTSGKVSFKLAGTTLKNGNSTLTANVYNGVAVAQVTTDSTWMNTATKNKTLIANYGGNSVYLANNSSAVKVNITNRTAKVSITSDRIVAHGGDNISITAVVTDEGKLVNGGVVVFKIAGQTIKDKNGNTIKVNVVNGYATLNYSIEIGASAKPNMTVEAVYSNSIYDRAENTSLLTVLKADVYFNTTIAYAKNGKAVINVTLRDAFGNLCVLDTLVAIKVDGKTFTHVTADDGKVYTTIDVSKLKAGVHTIEYVAGANNRYNDARYTNALVIE